MTTKPIDSIKIGNRFRKKLGDIEGLAESIQEVGLLQPVVIQPDGTLIAGERRIVACKQLGWTEIPVHVINLENALRGEYVENFQRKDYVASEAVDIGKDLEPLEIEEARERQGTRTDLELSKKFLESEKGEALVKVATVIGWSKPTYIKAKEICEAAAEEPDKYLKYQEEIDEGKKIAGVHKRMVNEQQAEQIAKEPPPLPKGPFHVIVIDPPWAYENRPDDASHRAANPYPSMTIDEIKALPISNLAHEDSILWLWTTNAHLPEAFGILQVWGFEYKTMLTWVKSKMGTGDWLRGKTEHCLMAKRGNPTRLLTDQTTVIEGKAREHSRKPEEFYQMVERLCPGGKTELFARTTRKGWTAHGSETELFS